MRERRANAEKVGVHSRERLAQGRGRDNLVALEAQRLEQVRQRRHHRILLLAIRQMGHQFCAVKVPTVHSWKGGIIVVK